MSCQPVNRTKDLFCTAFLDGLGSDNCKDLSFVEFLRVFFSSFK